MAEAFRFDFGDITLDVNEQFRNLNKDLAGGGADVQRSLEKLRVEGLVEPNIETGRIKIGDSEFDLTELNKEGATPLEVISEKLSMQGEGGARAASKFRDHITNNKSNFRTEAEIKSSTSKSSKFRQAFVEAYGDVESTGREAKETALTALKDAYEKIKSAKGSTAKELALFTLKYGLIAGLSVEAVLAIQNARNGCYLYNVGKDSNVRRISSSKNKDACACSTTPNTDLCMGKYNAFCCQYCNNDATWKGCGTGEATGTLCNCMNKNKLSKVDEQYGFRVVNAGFFDTIVSVISSVGLEIAELADGAIDLVEAGVKALANFFSQWWVILIIVVVALLIILIPTLVTQIPKAKAKDKLAGGRGRGGQFIQTPHYMF